MSFVGMVEFAYFKSVHDFKSFPCRCLNSRPACTNRATIPLPNVAVLGLPAVALLTFPGRLGLRISHLRPQPTQAPLPGQGVVVGGGQGLPPYSANRATAALLDLAVASLPAVTPGALPAGPGLRVGNFRPQPAEAPPLGQRLVISRCFFSSHRLFVPTVPMPPARLLRPRHPHVNCGGLGGICQGCGGAGERRSRVLLADGHRPGLGAGPPVNGRGPVLIAGGPVLVAGRGELFN